MLGILGTWAAEKYEFLPIIIEGPALALEEDIFEEKLLLKELPIDIEATALF